MDNPVVHIKDLHFAYPGSGHEALKGINLSVKNGEKLAIIGPNAAGKSTLMLHLNGILKGQGTVQIFGMNVEKQNLKEIRRRVGIVFQDPDDQLFCSTVFDDVAFGPLNLGLEPEKVRERVATALKTVELEGMDKLSAHHLSFGEKKRVSIATVLAMEPEVIVLDEPTSNLDPKRRRGFIEWMKKAPGTLIVATHDLDMALEVTDRALLLYEGEIVEQGPSSVLLKDEAALASCGLELPLMLQGVKSLS